MRTPRLRLPTCRPNPRPWSRPLPASLDPAKEYEGKPVEDLIAAIGEPLSSDYAPSCLGEGEDGNLYYDGFTVYTYRDDTGETVSYVE